MVFSAGLHHFKGGRVERMVACKDERPQKGKNELDSYLTYRAQKGGNRPVFEHMFYTMQFAIAHSCM